MTYRWYFGDLRTGKITRPGVDLVESSWSCLFDGPGALDGKFPIRALKASGGTLWPDAISDTTPAKQFMAVSYTDALGVETFLEGGPIWTTDFDDDNGILQIGAGGLWTYFDHRKVMAILAAGANPATSTVTYTTAELSLQAKRLVELAESHTGGDLPIVLPSDADLGGAGATHVRTYPGHELAWTGERLKQLTEVEGGPEIQFVPRRRSDDPRYLEWLMRIGVTPSMELSQTGAPWVFDHTVPKGPVTSLSVKTDGSQQAFRSWASGQGDAESKMIGRAEDLTLVDAGWPLLENEVTSQDNVILLDTLNAVAAEDVARGARPLRSYSLKVNRDARPNVGQYRPGDYARIRVAAHDFLPDGDIDVRILGLSGDTSSGITVAIADVP